MSVGPCPASWEIAVGCAVATDPPPGRIGCQLQPGWSSPPARCRAPVSPRRAWESPHPHPSTPRRPGRNGRFACPGVSARHRTSSSVWLDWRGRASAGRPGKSSSRMGAGRSLRLRSHDSPGQPTKSRRCFGVRPEVTKSRSRPSSSIVVITLSRAPVSAGALSRRSPLKDGCQIEARVDAQESRAQPGGPVPERPVLVPECFGVSHRCSPRRLVESVEYIILT